MKTRTAVLVIGLLAPVASVALMTWALGSNHTKLAATLNGDNEVCGVANCNDPNGTGRAVVRVRPANSKVCFTLRWSKISAPYAAHIHRGRAGIEGDVKITLFTARKLSANIKRVGGCVTGVNEELANRILRHPRRYYVNIHTPEYEGGAIRGQLHQ
jgi:CHRD domain